MHLIGVLSSNISDALAIIGKDNDPFLTKLQKETDELISVCDVMFQKNSRYRSAEQILAENKIGGSFEARHDKYFLMMDQATTEHAATRVEKILGKIENMFKEHDIDQQVEREYDQLIDINEYYRKKMESGVMVETPDDVLTRTRKLVNQIATDPEYQDSLFVSHQGVIEPILHGLMGIEIDVESYEDHLDIQTGALIRIDFGAGDPVLTIL